MSRTLIEWTDYSINPVKGLCPIACDYCYARRMYNRFKWNPELRFDPTVFNNLPTKPAKVFVGSTMELFLPECKAWLEKTFDLIKPYKWLTFQFLTKQPQNLPAFSPFPDHCYVGVTATNRQAYLNATGANGLDGIHAKVKYISLEPLLEEIMPSEYRLKGINWIIIGALTGTKWELLEISQKWNIANINQGLKMMPYGKKWTLQPKIEWVRGIVEAADKAGAKVFLKESLYELFMDVPHSDLFWEDMSHLRQEFPT